MLGCVALLCLLNRAGVGWPPSCSGASRARGRRDKHCIPLSLLELYGSLHGYVQQVQLSRWQPTTLPPRLLQAMSRPCYSAIRLHASGRGGGEAKPALVFVPNRKYARLTALDLLTHAAADGEPERFRCAPAAAACLGSPVTPCVRDTAAVAGSGQWAVGRWPGP
jgi:hypothetical protein